MPRPQTIQIFLPAGDPRGLRVAEITTRIVRVIEVPRSQLADFLKMPEAQQVGVYFLMGDLSEAGLPRAYIGQSGSVGSRLELSDSGLHWDALDEDISIAGLLAGQRNLPRRGKQLVAQKTD